MTSDQIKETDHDMCRARDTENVDTAAMIEIATWLKEIAYQLAVMNETRLDASKPLHTYEMSRFNGGDPR